MTLRRIEPMLMPGDLVRATDWGAKPELRWVKPTANGFNRAALREVVRQRRIEDPKRKEAWSLLETYLQALGML